jgi:hypothetical protein
MCFAKYCYYDVYSKSVSWMGHVERMSLNEVKMTRYTP